MANIQLSDEEQALIENLEAELGRPLTTTERQRAESFLASWSLSEPDNQMQHMIADLVDRMTGGILSPGLTFEEGGDDPYNIDDRSAPTIPSVGALQVAISDEASQVPGMTTLLGAAHADLSGGGPFTPGTPGTPGAPAPELVDGMPAQLQPSGELDAFGRPIIEGEVNGQTVVWDANLQQIAPAIIVGEDEEPMPDYLGGIPHGTELPQNLGEAAAQVEQERADFAGAFGSDRPGGVRLGTPTFTADVTYGTPTYMPGDQWTDFATKDPGYIRSVQEQLVSAGFLPEDHFETAAGTWSGQSARAMENAMIEANWTGGAKTWVDIVSERAAAAEEFREDAERAARRSRLDSRELVIPAYRDPDPAALEADVRQLMSSQLGGRKPLDHELALLGEYLSEQYRAKYDADVAAMRSEFEAGNRAIMQEGPGVTTGAATGPQIDPNARLQQMIEERYAPEIELNEDRAESRQNAENVFSIFTQSSRMLGGS